MRRAKLWEVFWSAPSLSCIFRAYPTRPRAPRQSRARNPVSGAPRSVRYLLHRALALVPRTKTTKQRRQRAPHNVAWKKRGAGMLSLPGGEASSGSVGPGLTSQVFRRIDRCLVHADLVVQVGAGGLTGRSDSPDDLSPSDLLPGYNINPAEVPVSRRDACSVVNQDFVSVTRLALRQDHDAVRSRFHLGTLGRRYVNPGVKGALTA